jgi:N-methylhydantoinase B
VTARIAAVNGLIRTLRFLCPVTVTLTGERRTKAPYGLQGGEPGKCGEHWLERDGQRRPLPGKATLPLQPGDILHVETPGGGGWGKRPS